MLCLKILKIIGSVLIAYPIALIIGSIQYPELEYKWLTLLIIGIIVSALLIFREIKNYKNSQKAIDISKSSNM